MHFAAPGQTILVIQERKSRAVLLAKQPSKAAQPVSARLLAWFRLLDRRLRKTITFDNGTEFAEHHILIDELAMRTFFCDPHSPWQKGSVENVIGRMRRSLPRKTNLNTIDDDILRDLVVAYNNTPRKCLGFKSPAQVFLSHLLHFKCESTPSLRSG
jgi:IS30 family transposase